MAVCKYTPVPPPGLTVPPIKLEAVRVVGFEREAVYSDDGADYLYSHFTLKIEGIVNAQATSYANNGGALVSQKGSPPAMTDSYIRHYLMQPRGLLQLWADDQNEAVNRGTNTPADWFESPLMLTTQSGAQRAKSDCLTGPRPINCNVLAVHGARTFLVSWTVETWLNETQATGQKHPALLSNRWSVAHRLGEDYFTTVTTTGAALLRRDVLDVLGQYADNFRNILGPPIYPGFKREIVDLSISPDETEVSYTVVDQEQPVEWAAGPFITRGEGSYDSSVDWGSGTNAVLNSTCTVRLWGNPTCPRNVLLNVGIAAMGACGFDLSNYMGTSAHISLDLFNKYVEISATRMAGGLIAGSIGALAGQSVKGVGANGVGGNGWDDGFASASPNPLGFARGSNRVAGFAPYTSGGLRGGSYVSIIILQALGVDGVAPPPNPAAAIPGQDIV